MFNYGLTLVAVMAVGSSILSAGKLNRNIGLILFGTGALILIYFKATALIWIKSLHANGKLLALMVLVQMLSIPLQYPRYMEVIKRFRGSFTGGGIKGLYLVSFTLSHLLAVILNFACIPICHHVLHEKGSDPGVKRTMMTAISRGYTTSCIWSPNTGAMALVLTWGCQWLDVLLPGMAMAAIALFVSWWLEKFRIRGERDDNRPEIILAAPVENITACSSRDTRQFVFVIAMLLSLIILLDYHTTWGIITIVPLVSLLSPPLWSLGVGEGKAYLEGLGGYVKNRIPSMNNEVIIFLGAGFFASAVGFSPIGGYISAFFSGFAGSPLAISTLMGALIIGLSLLGCHPVLTTSALVATLSPELLQCTAKFLALSALVGWSLAITSSPFSACSLSVAAITQKSSVEVGIKWHLAFTLVMFCISVLFIVLLNLIVNY